MNMNFPLWLSWVGRYLLTIKITDLLDIAIMVFIFYQILKLVQSTKAASLLKGLFIFFAALMLSYVFRLNGIYFIMSRMMNLGVIVLIILFQPEIRRLLEQVGSRRFMNFFTHTDAESVMDRAIRQTVLACTDMAQSRTGALIVFEREILLDDMVRSGTVLDAAVSSELLKNIFFVKAPMHDGAVIVRHGRVLGAGCMLPLSKNVNLSRDLGMRHRAGIGMSENSDAVVVIVSEETGSISVAYGGMLKRHLKPETLENLLRNELIPQEETESDKQKFSLLNLLHSRKNGGADDE
ncbi:MAG: diadenylate cyclase CdaA [Oscillibacter sp.]|nr:diadenylate cyclase CdaA [Oscillibacter sp.]